MKALKGYMLTILGPDDQDGENMEQEVKDALAGRALLDAEDVINDHLPDGYSTRINEASLLRS